MNFQKIYKEVQEALGPDDFRAAMDSHEDLFGGGLADRKEVRDRFYEIRAELLRDVRQELLIVAAAAQEKMMKLKDNQ